MSDETRDVPDRPIIFTAGLLAAAAMAPKHAAPLLLRWAAQAEDCGGPRRREQIERAAAMVPIDQRPRVLGQLLGKSASDDQVRAALGSLLLGKMLTDLGWHLEFEPDLAGGTPDFRITKGDQSFFVELRRVASPPRQPSDATIAAIRDALANLETHTPITVRSAHVSGRASLKPFVRHLKTLLAGNPEPGRHTFHEGEVLVVFNIGERWTEAMPAFFGWSGAFTYGGQHAEVREHLNAKLSKYKIPLIVALDFVDPLEPFRTVEETLLGRPVMRIPVDLSGGGAVGEPERGRADDGIIFGGSSDSERARSRLQAVLPFCLRTADDGSFAVQARALANPGMAMPLSLEAFAPIPRLVVTDESKGVRTMDYLDAKGMRFDVKALASWQHVP